MKSNRDNRRILVMAAAVFGVFTFPARAAVTISSTAPTVDGADIANLSWTDTQADKTWTDTPNHGQSFTTGSNTAGYVLHAFSMQVNTNSSTDPVPADKAWSIRLVTIDPDNTNTSTSVLETGHVSSGVWTAGDWFTWTVGTPIALAANTLYGIDVELTSGGAYQQGIPYFRYNRSDDVAGGYRYTRTDGDPATISASTSTDRVFHIDLAAVPEPAAALLGSFGMLVLLRRRR